MSQHNTEINTHPLYRYVEFARHTVHTRFPNGAGDLVNLESKRQTIQEIINNLEAFHLFSSSPMPNSHTYARILSDLQSGSADVLCCYALGALRREYPDHKDLFNMIYIHQELEHVSMHTHTHSLLIIGPSLVFTDLELAFKNNDQQLICDLWLNDIYLAKDFHNHQSSSREVDTLYLMKHVPSNTGVGIYSTSVCPLRGKISLYSIDDFETFYQILENTVDLDKQRTLSRATQSEGSSEAKYLPELGFFSELGRKRTVWEHNNPFIVGYITDRYGVCHTIRKLNQIRAFAFWDEEKQEPVTITFKKIDGHYVSDMGTLSKTPSVSAEAKLS